jgi:hypothetical protein
MKPQAFLVLALGLSVVMSACSGDDEVPTVDCATADVKPYSQLGDVMGYCTPCHSGANAPEGVRFDTYADAAADAARGAAEIESGEMPQGGGMPESAQQAFIAWALCGKPE